MNADANLDQAIHHMERLMDAQLDSVAGLSNKAGTLLGFVLASFGIIFAVTRDLLLTHLAAASLAASFMIVSSVGLGYSYRLTTYVNPPQPRKLVILLEEEPSDLKRAVLGALVEAHSRNEETIRRRFQFLNASLAFFIWGVSLFVLTVVMI